MCKVCRFFKYLGCFSAQNEEAEAELEAYVKSVLVKSLASSGMDDLSAQQGWNRLTPEDKKRFEERWKALQLWEFECYSQKSGFIHEVVTKMTAASRPRHLPPPPA